MKKCSEEKFNKQMESYLPGIRQDLKMGRDIDAIIQGFGFIYEADFDKAKEWCKKQGIVLGEER